MILEAVTQAGTQQVLHWHGAAAAAQSLLRRARAGPQSEPGLAGRHTVTVTVTVLAAEPGPPADSALLARACDGPGGPAQSGHPAAARRRPGSRAVQVPMMIQL